VAQGGLLDVALAPDFADSRVIYLSFAKPLGLMRSATAVVRATLSDDRQPDRRHRDLRTIPPRACRSISAAASPRTPMARSGSPLGERGGTPGLRERAQDPPTTYGAVVRVTQDGAPARATRSSTSTRRRARTRDAGTAQHPGCGPCAA
jgi:glucose/arabinose dehydrogenase